MNAFYKVLSIAAAAALTFVACTKEIEAPIENSSLTGITSFKFKANTENLGTKATLAPENDEETSFAAAWENGDEMVIESLSLDPAFDEFGTAVWDSSEEVFNATYDESVTLPTASGDWTYSAWYPAKASVPFQSNRVQNGNAYASEYDLMYGSIEVDGAQIGKNANGTSLVIPMNRLTAIAYYHITGGPNEDVVSATLTVDEGKTIAAETVEISGDGKTITPTNGSNTITITFEDGTAPKATNFQLWFNILTENIGSASSYNVTVDIVTTGHTAKLTSKSARSFTAGKLNKAVLSGLNWTAKPQSYTIDFINKTTKSVITISNSTAASTVIETASLSYVTASPFTTATNAYYGGDETNGLPVRIGKSSAAGTLTIKLSETGCVSASAIIVNAKQYSSGKTKTIGVNDSAKQQPGDEYEDLEFAINSDIEEISLQTDGYIYVKYVKVVYTPKKSVTLSFPQESYSITAGDSFTAPTLTTDPAGLTVTYSSSDETIATVNASTGEVSLEGGIGSTTITATFAGDDEYKSGSAFYTLTVNRALSTSISQIKEDLDGSTTAMSFTASLTNAVVTRKYSDKVAYIQDDTAGILVTDAADLTEGDSYTGTVSGTMVTANHQPKITSIDVSEATKATGATKTPVEVTIATLVSNMSTYDGKLCKIVKAKANATLETGNNKSIIIAQGENTMTLFTRASFEANTIVSGSYYDVVGIPCLYNTTNEIVVISTADVTEVSITWQLASIAVKSAPKTSYTEGEFFDPAGMVLSTTEEDTTDPNITRSGEDVAYGVSTASSFSFDPELTTALSTTNTSVTITYSGKSTTQAITVSEEGGGDTPTDFSSVYTSNVSLITGTSAQEYTLTIDGYDYSGIKAGASKSGGSMKFSIPSGTTRITLHAQGWGSDTPSVSIEGASIDPSSFSPTANAAYSGTGTSFTITTTNSDYYVFEVSGVTTETEITLSTSSGKNRFVVWGVNVE